MPLRECLLSQNDGMTLYDSFYLIPRIRARVGVAGYIGESVITCHCVIGRSCFAPPKKGTAADLGCLRPFSSIE